MEKNPTLYSRLATLYPLGNSPAAPGTVATLLAGIPCFLLVGHFSWQTQAALAFALLFAGSHVCGEAERQMGRTDPQQVVLDELCGYLFAMVGHPIGFLSVITGALLFRVFDIWKPWPIRLVEKKLTGGIAIMLDDVVAGIFANILGLIILKMTGLGYK